MKASAAAVLPSANAGATVIRRQCGCGQHTGGGTCGRCSKSAFDRPAGAPAMAASQFANDNPRHDADLSRIPAGPRPEHDVRVYADSGKSGGGDTGTDAQKSGAPRDAKSGPASAADSSPGTGGGFCDVEHFSLKMGGWDTSWPWTQDGKTSIQLPVIFRLDLLEGSKKSDCVITQDKRGYVPTPLPADEFTSWTPDAPGGGWWDGEDWNGANGRWGGFLTDSATFYDKPGLDGARSYDYPLYYGGMGRTGHFEFRTLAKDRKSGSIVRKLEWGMLIDYSAPKVGKHEIFL